MSVEEVRGPWSYQLTYDLDRPSPEPVQLRIRPTDRGPDAPPLTADVVRQTPLRRLQQKAEDKLAADRTLAEEFAPAMPVRFVDATDYALLADAYVRALEQGHRHPIARLSRAWGISPNTLNDRLRKAQQTLGLLTRSGTDQAKWRLTTKARRLLREGMPDTGTKKEAEDDG